MNFQPGYWSTRMKHCFRQNFPQGTVQTLGCFSATTHIIIIYIYIYIYICYFSFCVTVTGNHMAMYSFSRRTDQDQVRPLLHFENYASFDENGWSLNLMFSGTKDCDVPSLSDTLFSLPHRGNLGMYKCFCKICSIVFRFSDKNVAIWMEIRTCFKRINRWYSNSD